ncbi:CPBP family glutamic-type intramembrane protease [Sphingobacterium sp. MYb388]|uniref:CPBP family glutamic-type intramembrane protease n=1 Tax=Sphingobacterium sp. MYb388 TaxID=2745437 RepID=UPI0030A018C9
MNNYLKSILILIFLILYSIVGSRLITIDNAYQSQDLFKSTIPEMIMFFFIGAMVETLILNLLFIYLILRFFPKLNTTVIIIAASLIFGLVHFSSWQFVLITFVAGVLLNYNFLLYKTSLVKATLLTFLIHFISNMCIYFIDIMSLNK